MFGDDDFFRKQVLANSGRGNSSVHVLLHSTAPDIESNEDVPTYDDPLLLEDRLWLCRVPKDIQDVIYTACESGSVPAVNPFRQYRQLYTAAYFQGPWMAGNIASWDPYGRITQFFNMSQLVHRTSTGFANTATLTLLDVAFPTLVAGELAGYIGGALPVRASYLDIFGTETFLVSGSLTSVATPEPSSIALLGTGVLAVISAARRRFATA